MRDHWRRAPLWLKVLAVIGAVYVITTALSLLVFVIVVLFAV